MCNNIVHFRYSFRHVSFFSIHFGFFRSRLGSASTGVWVKSLGTGPIGEKNWLILRRVSTDGSATSSLFRIALRTKLSYWQRLETTIRIPWQALSNQNSSSNIDLPLEILPLKSLDLKTSCHWTTKWSFDRFSASLWYIPDDLKLLSQPTHNELWSET